MYGYGVILYYIVTGVVPFSILGNATFDEQVFKKNYRPPLDFDEYNRKIKAKPEIKSFIEKCWDVDYLKRPTAKEALDLFTRLEQNAINKKKRQLGVVTHLKNLLGKKDTI